MTFVALNFNAFLTCLLMTSWLSLIFIATSAHHYQRQSNITDTLPQVYVTFCCRDLSHYGWLRLSWFLANSTPVLSLPCQYSLEWVGCYNYTLFKRSRPRDL